MVFVLAYSVILLFSRLSVTNLAGSSNLFAMTFDHLMGAIHSTKISGNFGPKLNGSVRSNRKSFEKTGPPFEVVLFSRSDQPFWLSGSCPYFGLVTFLSRSDKFCKNSKRNRPNRLTQCCTQFKPFGNKTFCFRNFHII